MSWNKPRAPQSARSDHATGPLSPAYTQPRRAPLPPVHPTQGFSLSAVFNRTRAPSLRSVYSTSTATTNASEHSTAHPYSVMHVAPLPVVSNQENPDEEEECPVCLEPLSFSFRLPGEKPHIVPECGHALHEACFTAVYGPPPSQARSTVPRKSNLGVCGVCRRPMKVGDGDGSKSNKLASLTGTGPGRGDGLYPGRDTPTASRKGRAPSHARYDPNDDDPIEHAPSVKSHHGEHANTNYIVAPSIQVRPEFSSLTRTTDNNQPLTCIVVIELPGKRIATGPVPGPVMSDVRSRSGRSSPRPDSTRRHGNGSDRDHRAGSDRDHRAGSDRESHRDHHRGGDRSPPQYASSAHDPEEDSPFVAITEDLRNRIIDWKGHPMSDLGALQMYDLLGVRRDAIVREFYVYLFKEALICVAEERKRSLGRLLSSASGVSETPSSSTAGAPRGVLRLRGRIYVRHIKHVTASSSAGEMSLTIDMEDELASFILIFKERGSLEAWKNKIQALVNHFQALNPQSQAEPERPLDMEEFGGSAKAMRMLSGGSGTTSSTGDSSLLNSSSARSTMSSSTSHGSLPPPRSGNNNYANKLSPLGEDDEMSTYDSSPTGLVTPYTSAGPSNSLSPLPHPPLDLILVVSLPPPGAAPSTAALKVRVIKATLDFTLASLAPKDRLSLVTFEVGQGGRVRRTPFLYVGKAQSRARLEKFIDEIGVRVEEGMDEFLVRGSKEEKTDVVTAVNHGLDVVLQRKAKNPVSGMMLVLPNVPIHSFGYGRSHDPASLWLMSNHTSGTYTFVKDWYDLRDCVAGCVGGMMSIGLCSMKLHMKVVDGLAGELRYGERKEMLIELELDNSDMQAKMAAARQQQQHHGGHGQRGANGRTLNATDQFVASMGLDALAIDDAPDFADGMMDRMIDEVPVVEVDWHVSRLAHPVLLTVTLLPAQTGVPRPPAAVSDPVIVRRRMELLASDMITRALVLQAQKILGETKRILHTPNPNNNYGGNGGGTSRNRRELLTLSAVRAMQAMSQDLAVLSEALDENVELFAHDQRNFGAQQAMILRDQKSWTGRSATERLFWTTDNSIELVSRSTDWVARD
ncbi:Pleckstrin homology domain-containing protein [Mycena metata]|uniref:Pleckstrin homology domain-containing protein n=1 Tax=Mycena metata TaxID=1033252 RepID=A0AAD7JDR1_9AGAR|nr:Pleckstrin homology domain-containing protein [Mycena metata]